MAKLANVELTTPRAGQKAYFAHPWSKGKASLRLFKPCYEDQLYSPNVKKGPSKMKGIESKEHIIQLSKKLLLIITQPLL